MRLEDIAKNPLPLLVDVDPDPLLEFAEYGFTEPIPAVSIRERRDK